MSKNAIDNYIDQQFPNNDQQLIKAVNARNVTKRLNEEAFNKQSDDSDDINEGLNNKFYSNELVDDRVAQLIQDSDDGKLTWSYDDTNGTLTPEIDFSSLGDQDLEAVLSLGNDAGNQQIKNIADATDPQDAVSFEQLGGLIDGFEEVSNKDALNGYVGLSSWSIKFRNLANTFTSLLQNAATAIRTYTFPDKDITVAGLDDVQNGLNYAASTGTNTYAATLSPVPTSYATGRAVRIKIGNSSSGASTLNLNSIGAKKIYKDPTTQAGNGDLLANYIYTLNYDAALDSGNGGFLMSSTVVPVASTSVAGVVQLDTDGNVQSNANPGRVVTSGNLAAWWTWVKTQAQTWSLKHIFTGGIQIPSSAGVYDANGNKILEFSGTTSATDYLQLINAISSGAVTLIPAGATTNMPLRIASKGAASFFIRTNSTDRIEITSAGLLKLLAYTATYERVLTAATDGTVNSNYGIRDPRICQFWTPLTAITTTVDTPVWGADYGSLTIPSTDINRLGAMIWSRSRHQLDCGATTGESVTFTLKWGSTTLFSLSLALTGYAGVSNSKIYFEIDLTTTATGATGKVKGRVLITNSSTMIHDYEFEPTLDLTASNPLSLSIQFTASSVATWTPRYGINKFLA